MALPGQRATVAGGRRRQVGAGFAGWRQILGAGDFDGDGYPDVLGVSPTGALWLFSGNGFGGWRSQRQVGDGCAPVGAAH